MFPLSSNCSCLPTVTNETCFMGRPSHVASYWRRGIASRPIPGGALLVCCRSSAKVKTVAAVSARLSLL